MNKEQYKELLIKLHRLEDDLVGAQVKVTWRSTAK
jgi:hypothetical protein